MLAVAILVSTIAFLDSTVVNLALPAIKCDLFGRVPALLRHSYTAAGSLPLTIRVSATAGRLLACKR